MAKRKYKQGRFIPVNKEKYVGDISKIQYRSSWEQKFMLFLDMNPSISWWNSEEVVIPYIFSIDGTSHRYFVDFMVQLSDGRKFLIEIKPMKDTIIKENHKNKKQAMDNITTVIKNENKWEAAKKFCEENDMKFLVLTEKELFGK